MCDGEGDKVCERETEGVQDRGRGQKEGVRKTRREKRKKKQIISGMCVERNA